MELGLRSGRVRVVPHEPGWADEGAAEAARVLAAGAPLVLRVEHVGSTAVPGLPAKPVVDLAVGVRDLRDATALAPALAGLGYDFPGDVGIPDDLVFGRARGFRTHLLHVVVDGGPRWRAYLTFRDALRGSGSLRAEYAGLKTALAAAHPDDRAVCTAAKAGFVERALTGGVIPRPGVGVPRGAQAAPPLVTSSEPVAGRRAQGRGATTPAGRASPPAPWRFSSA